MTRILAPGRTCERIARADSSGVLVDARDYYRAFHTAVQRAERYVLIAGWEFDSRVELLRGPDAEGAAAPTRLLPLLEWAVARRPELHVYLLAWDYSLFYALEREWMQRLEFDWRTNDRIRFVFDDQHATGASHHQKLAVLDGALAFVGGIDLCDPRWDDRRHAPHDPLRVTLRGTAHKPYHDVMSYCTGPAAAELAQVFAERWRRATSETLDLPEPAATFDARLDGALPIARDQVGISLTYGEHAPSGTPQVEQIRRLYEEAFASAERLIYVETQYFSSRALREALCARLSAGGPALDVVIVKPRGADSPKERLVLEDAQRWVLGSLAAAARDRGHRVRVLYSAEPDEQDEPVATYVHSKLLAVDDRLLSIGSANCTNRSMSLDSELNLTWECEDATDPLAACIGRLRASLLCEHAKIPYDAALERSQGLIDRLDPLIDTTALRAHELPESPAEVERDPLLVRAFDPSRAVTDVELDEFLEPRRD